MNAFGKAEDVGRLLKLKARHSHVLEDQELTKHNVHYRLDLGTFS